MRDPNYIFAKTFFETLFPVIIFNEFKYDINNPV